jgi:hypothetical protein
MDAMVDIRSALDAISLFHQLRHARDIGVSLSADEQRALHVIRSAFEPPYADRREANRMAIRLPVIRPARIAARGRLIGARAVVLTLRTIDVVPAEPLVVGERADVSVASIDGRTWYSFHGRVVRSSRSRLYATIALLPGPRRGCREEGTDADPRHVPTPDPPKKDAA